MMKSLSHIIEWKRFSEFANKRWTHSGLNQLLQKIDATHSVDHSERNGRPKSGR